MFWLRVSFTALALTHAAHAATVTLPLSIVNKVIAPDGYPRSYVYSWHLASHCLASLAFNFFYFLRAITPNGTFPGPTIKLQKGDRVNIPVHNALTDPGMRRSTSIVSLLFSHPRASLVGNLLSYFLSSTGMDFSRRVLLMRTGLREYFFLPFYLVSGIGRNSKHRPRHLFCCYTYFTSSGLGSRSNIFPSM
jgi:hypothetical protein